MIDLTFMIQQYNKKIRVTACNIGSLAEILFVHFTTNIPKLCKSKISTLMHICYYLYIMEYS